jgi:hypothetical protein
MKRFKNFRFIAGISLILVGVGLVAGYFLHTPAREVGRGELQELLAQGQIT